MDLLNVGKIVENASKDLGHDIRPHVSTHNQQVRHSKPGNVSVDIWIDTLAQDEASVEPGVPRLQFGQKLRRWHKSGLHPAGCDQIRHGRGRQPTNPEEGVNLAVVQGRSRLCHTQVFAPDVLCRRQAGCSEHTIGNRLGAGPGRTDRNTPPLELRHIHDLQICARHDMNEAVVENRYGDNTLWPGIGISTHPIASIDGRVNC